MNTDWERIRREHAPAVWSVAWRILKHHADALDCSQDVFIEAMRRSETSEIEDWNGFLRWLTTRRALDYARRRQRRRTDLDSSYCMDDLRSSGEAVDAPLTHSELVDRVRGELSELSDAQATAFWLACVVEMSYREVAKHMEITTNEVGVLVHRARKSLRRSLADLKESNN